MSVFTLRISHIAAQGKIQALRAALEEHTRASNAAGGRYNLTQRLFGSEVAFVNGMQFDGLAALDAYRASSPSDSARQDRLNKVNATLGRPNTSGLFETLVPAAPVSSPPAYGLRVTWTPALGKAPELRKLLEERAKVSQKGALAGVGLSAQVAPEGGANFVSTIRFANLAGLEEFRTANQSDPSFAAFQAKLAGLLAEPPRQELHAILVPFGAK